MKHCFSFVFNSKNGLQGVVPVLCLLSATLLASLYNWQQPDSLPVPSMTIKLEVGYVITFWTFWKRCYKTSLSGWWPCCQCMQCGTALKQGLKRLSAIRFCACTWIFVMPCPKWVMSQNVNSMFIYLETRFHTQKIWCGDSEPSTVEFL